MDLLKLSKFQLQLRALISEVHHLKERDQSTSKQLQLLVQKEKKADEETNKKLAELQAELVVSNELQQKLERKVNCLESENALLENRQKELKETINNLLQSRESFIKAYEDSTCEMKRAMESRDRMITFLSEKIKAHSLLVNSIQKEASSIQQIVNDTQCVMNEKEEAAVKLKKKLHEIATFEKLFIERISDLECKKRNSEEELTRKDKIILGLEAQLKMADTQDKFQPTIDELQKALSTKELIIQNLMSQKKVLHLEVGSLSFIIKKIQDAVTLMDEKDREAFSSVLEGQEEFAIIEENNTNGITDGPEDNGEICDQKAFGKEPGNHSVDCFMKEKENDDHGLLWITGSKEFVVISVTVTSPTNFLLTVMWFLWVHPCMMNFKSCIPNRWREDNNVESCASESACSPSKLPPQLAAPIVSRAQIKS